jgi:hypothetical protein
MRRRLSLIAARAARLGARLAGRLSLALARAPGQGLVEYGLILVLIMVVCVGILSLIGGTVSHVWYDKLINNGAW